MLARPRRTLAERTARAVLLELGIDAAPVCPFAIACKKGIEVNAMPQGNAGCSGMLIRVGDSYGILYATHIASQGFQRFSIAHELGHYFLAGHPEVVLKQGAHRSHAGFESSDPYEVEADVFAASLLMPKGPFRRAASREIEGLQAILALAEMFDTSLTATALRYAEHAGAAVAIVKSSQGSTDWCVLSERMKRLRPSWLRIGSPLPVRALARAGLGSSEKASSVEVDLADWFSFDKGEVGTEEAIGMPAGGALTILVATGAQLEDEPGEDEISNDELIERWTPRFRS